MVERFTTVDEVKSVAGLQNSEVSDAEIAEHINRVTSVIVEAYGNPIKKSNITLEDDEYIYDYTGNKKATYRVDYVESNGSEITIDTGSIINIDLDKSFITLASNIIENDTGERLEVEYIPKKANLLCTYKSALEVLENLFIVTGDESLSPKIQRLVQTAGSIQNLFNDDVQILMSSKGSAGDGRLGDAITQNFDNTY